MTRSSLLPLRPLPAVLALFLLTTALLTWGGGPARAAESPHGSGCGPTEGVTVVVDFTDLGGSIEVGCAEGDPTSGREALESAGFTPTDSSPGMICAINAQPDPCPEEFTGSFWSYWHGENGEWTTYEMGADKADPAPGEVEGWRYSDGSAGPGLAPTAAVSAGNDSTEGDSAEGGSAEGSAEGAAESADQAAEAADQADFDPAGLVAAGAVAVVLIIGIVLVLRRRRALHED